MRKSAMAFLPVILACSFLAGMWVIACRPLSALSCTVTKHRTPTDADKALANGDYAKAADLYKAELTAKAGDPDAQLGLIHALLRQQKVDEAADAVKSALAATPQSGALVT